MQEYIRLIVAIVGCSIFLYIFKVAFAGVPWFKVVMVGIILAMLTMCFMAFFSEKYEQAIPTFKEQKV